MGKTSRAFNRPQSQYVAVKGIVALCCSNQTSASRPGGSAGLYGSDHTRNLSSGAQTPWVQVQALPHAGFVKLVMPQNPSLSRLSRLQKWASNNNCLIEPMSRAMPPAPDNYSVLGSLWATEVWLRRGGLRALFFRVCLISKRCRVSQRIASGEGVMGTYCVYLGEETGLGELPLDAD